MVSKEEQKAKSLERKWSRQKKVMEQKLKIRQEKRRLRETFKKPPTSKLLIIFLFLNCSIIELFTGYITLKSFALAKIIGYAPDLSPLIALISTVVGEVIGYAIYSIKAMKENSANGITYELAMKQFDIDNADQDDPIER